MTNPVNDQDKEAKLKEFWERARKGVLKHINEKGTLKLADLHDYSMKTYFIQHQRFSQMMESFVDEGLIHYDDVEHTAMITDAGKEFIKS